MQQLSIAFTEVAELVAFLEDDNTVKAIADARSVLAQIYTGVCDEEWSARLVEEVAGASDKIAIAGATTFGEIESGRAIAPITGVRFGRRMPENRPWPVRGRL